MSYPLPPRPPPPPRVNVAGIAAITLATLAIIAGVAVGVVAGNQDRPVASEPSSAPAAGLGARPTPSAAARLIRFEVTGAGTVSEVHWLAGDESAVDEDARLPWVHEVPVSAVGDYPNGVPVQVRVSGGRGQALTCKITAGGRVMDEKTSDHTVTCSGTA